MNERNLKDLQEIIREKVDVKFVDSAQRFFKSKPGQYGNHDEFLGVRVPILREIAKDFYHLCLDDLKKLLYSNYNEERLIALFILIKQYQKAKNASKQELYEFYIEHKSRVNNWNLVDSSAHLIVGDFLFDKSRDFLFELAESEILWDRRIAIVATWYFIRKNDFATTFSLAEKLLNDKEDLMHKAVGWMLKEAGEKNEALLINWLHGKFKQMPRTMLRCSIEKLNPDYKALFLSK